MRFSNNSIVGLTIPVKCDILISQGSTNGFVKQNIRSLASVVADHLDRAETLHKGLRLYTFANTVDRKVNTAFLIPVKTI